MVKLVDVAARRDSKKAPKDQGASFMTRPLRTILALAAVGLSAFAVSASPAVAANKPACWKVVINDWYDGQITGKYALHCYREALV